MTTAEHTLELAYAGPYDWQAMSEWLGARAIDGIESVHRDGRYVRSISLGGEIGTIEVTPSAGTSALRVTIVFGNAGALPAIVERIRRIFDLDADIETIAEHLSADARLAPLLARRPGLRVPGAWDGYELAVRAILGQQISVNAASSLAGRLVRRFGSPLPAELRAEGVELVFPDPEHLAEADVVSLGMPRARAEAVRTIARAAAEDPSIFMPSFDLAGSCARLRRLRGVGEWTAQYIAMRALREPDAFPASDIGLMRAIADDGGLRPSARELAATAEPWRPWRAYAALHLWADDAERERARRKIA